MVQEYVAFIMVFSIWLSEVFIMKVLHTF